MPVEHTGDKLITLFIQMTSSSVFKTVLPRQEAEALIEQWKKVREGRWVTDNTNMFITVKYKCCVTTICLLSVIAMGTDERNILEIEEAQQHAEEQMREKVEETMSAFVEAARAAAKEQNEGEEWRESLREDDDDEF